MITDKFLVGGPQADTRLTGRKIIVAHLRLREPVYLKTAAYGHFDRDEFTLGMRGRHGGTAGQGKKKIMTLRAARERSGRLFAMVAGWPGVI